ncbi:hypothetical protein ACLKA6_011406 [Drosophila palustris]
MLTCRHRHRRRCRPPSLVEQKTHKQEATQGGGIKQVGKRDEQDETQTWMTTSCAAAAACSLLFWRIRRNLVDAQART